MSFTNARERHESSLDDGPVRYLPCRYCAKQTLVENLSHYGARCLECFEAYCSKAGPEIPQGRRIVTPDKARLRAHFVRLAAAIHETQGNSRSRAETLRERHEAGEILTRAQVEAYKVALGHVRESETADEAQ